ncbi:MAG: STAS domain-containing protein [Trueperaceae bacterium]|nr:MAG: STAS domain-containing protein [Trueperaceae bacterium]
MVLDAPVSGDVPRVPLQLSRKCLVASLQIDLTEEVLDQFRTDLLEALQATEAVGVIIEVSGLDVIDVEEFDALRKTMVMVQLMGAKTVIAGLRPGVVSSLVQLDAATDEVDAAMNLDDAFERIEALVAGDGDEVEE